MRIGSGCRTALTAAIVSLGCLLATLPAQALEVGDVAPDFELPASDGQTYRLRDVLNRSVAVVAWFPQAFTSGCTVECRSLVQNGAELRRFDVQYFMASVDPLVKNQRFAESMDADFPLLSDADKSVAQQWGVLYQNRFALRHTFYIGQDGKILAIDRNVNPETSAEDMLAKLQALEVGQAEPDQT